MAGPYIDSVKGFGAAATPLPIYRFDFAAGQKVALTTASAQSAAIDAQAIAIIADADAWITVGTNPTAAATTAGNWLLKAGAELRLKITPGDKVAGVTGTTGALYIVPLA